MQVGNESKQLRLQSYLAQAGVSSRRAAEKLIAEGRVSVDGKVRSEPGVKVFRDSSVIKLDGKTISISSKRIFIFHKPDKVVSTLNDPEGRPNLGDYIRRLQEVKKVDNQLRLFSIGRLDFDVAGLILLTNDGDYANRLMHPRFEVPREYLARVSGKLTRDLSRLLIRGVKLDDGKGKAENVAKFGEVDSYTLNLLGKCHKSESMIRLVVKEGRYHFVKNLLEAVDLPVIKLARIAYGPYTLGHLKSGSSKEVSFKSL